MTIQWVPPGRLWPKDNSEGRKIGGQPSLALPGRTSIGTRFTNRRRRCRVSSDETNSVSRIPLLHAFHRALFPGLIVVSLIPNRTLRAQPVVAPVRQDATQGPGLRIGSITIRNLDVYSSKEATRGWLYDITDRLHIETRQSVISKFLLFKEGDELRPDRLAETERNLRALHFLKSASVTASEAHDGVVDIVVTTQDAWSVAPETQAGSKGGAATFGANLSDTNFLGYGKELDIGWDHNVDRTSTAIDYQDPAFFGPYWNARFTYGSNSDGYNHRVVVRRPFYAFSAPWSVDLAFNSMKQDDRIYGRSILQEKFRQNHRGMLLSFGRALTDRDDMANRIVAGLRHQRDDFTTLGGYEDSHLPLSRDFRYAFVRFEHVENRFLKLNFVNKDLRYEDFNLGKQYSLETAISPRTFGAEANSGFVRGTAAKGFALGDSAFIMPSVALESRVDHGLQNTIASGTFNLVRRFSIGGDHPSAFVGRVVVTDGWRVDHDVQFFADGVTGLRGYRVHAFSGTKAALVNLEQRFYLGRELLQLFSPGFVVFADAGNATNGTLRDLMQLKSDVGVGIRIGLPRTPRNLLRLDLSYALNRDALGKRGLLVSVSSGQAF
jgi:hypothetical protein